MLNLEEKKKQDLEPQGAKDAKGNYLFGFIDGKGSSEGSKDLSNRRLPFGFLLAVTRFDK